MGTLSRTSPTGSEDEETEVGTSAFNPIALTVTQLQKLQERFLDRDGVKVKLTEEEFVAALGSSRSHSDSQAQRQQWESELRTLFKKIDASCTDTVDWEDFTNYMLMHMPGFNAREGNAELCQGAQGGDTYTGAWCSGHTDMINSVVVVYDMLAGGGGGGVSSSSGVGGTNRRYITAGRDGVVKAWFPNLTLHKAVHVGQQKSWLTACCWMPKARMLAVATSKFKIHFFDSALNPTPNIINHKDGTPRCLGYTEYESDGREKGRLMVGDSDGYVTVYPMDEESFSQEKDGEMKFRTISKTKYHTGWVTKVGYVQDFNAMVTCGMDGDINLCDLHTNERKGGKGPVRLHNKKGVHSWCWCKGNKCFASGGLDRQIILWSPYKRRAIYTLKGHNAAILDVLVNENQHHLISMSVDKVVKVWDLRNYQCMQTFTDKTEYKPEDRLTCMALDEEGPALVMCSNSLNILPVNVKVDTNRTHLAPIIGALYNDVFHLVVSADMLGTICVWDVRTGKLDFEFRPPHQEHKLTCMAFDYTRRCLFTGAEDGMVQLWNFSSGAHLQTFVMPQPSEITELLWAKEGPNTFVVGLAWGRKIYIWPDSKKEKVEVQHILEDPSGHGHTDDISCICRCSMQNGLVATGGHDGFVIFWKVQDSSSNSVSSRPNRLSDTTPATPQQDELKPGSHDARTPRKPKKNGKSLHEGDGASVPTALGSTGRGAAETSGSTKSKQKSSLLSSNPPLPGQVRSDVENEPSETTSARDVGFGSRELLEELGFDYEHANMSAPGVEQMIWLEHKDCLFTMHSDRRLRVWSTKKCEFLQRLDLLAPVRISSADLHAEDTSEKGTEGSEQADRRGSAQAASRTRPDAPMLVPAQKARVVSLHAESAGNKWLLTGDMDGYVRAWDLSPFNPARGSTQPYLVRMCEFQPHRHSVTHLQYFELDGQAVVMSASVDCTVVLCTLQGERIGTFSTKGPHWQLAERNAWCSTPPVVEEGPWLSEEDDGWGRSPRRAGAGATTRQHHGRASAGSTSGVGPSGSLARSSRQPRTRGIAQQSHGPPSGLTVWLKRLTLHDLKPAPPHPPGIVPPTQRFLP